jgi:hypothetical protein
MGVLVWGGEDVHGEGEIWCRQDWYGKQNRGASAAFGQGCTETTRSKDWDRLGLSTEPIQRFSIAL